MTVCEFFMLFEFQFCFLVMNASFRVKFWRFIFLVFVFFCVLFFLDSVLRRRGQEGRKEGRTDGRTDGRKKGRKEGRNEEG